MPHRTPARSRNGYRRQRFCPAPPLLPATPDQPNGGLESANPENPATFFHQPRCMAFMVMDSATFIEGYHITPHPVDGHECESWSGGCIPPYPFMGHDHSRQIAAGLYMNNPPWAGQITDGIITFSFKCTKDTRDSLMMSTNFCLKSIVDPLQRRVWISSHNL